MDGVYVTRRPDAGTSSLASTPSNSDESLLSLDGGYYRYNYKKAHVLAWFYARFFWIIAASAGSIGIVSCVFTARHFTNKDFTDFDNPTTGFDARNTHISMRSRTFLALNRDVRDHVLAFFPNQSLIHEESRYRRDLGESEQHAKTPSFNLKACKNQSIDTKKLKLVFKSTERSGDLFTLRSFQSICDLENMVILPSLYPHLVNHECQHMVSLPILTAIYRQKTCRSLTQADINAMKTLLEDCFPYFKKGKMADDSPTKCLDGQMISNIFYYLTDHKFQPSHNSSYKLTYTSLFYNIYPPNLKKYFKDTFEGKAFSHGSVKLVSVYGTVMEKFSLFSDYLESDLKNYIGFLATGLILTIVLLYLFSFVLVFATLFNVFFSFSTAFIIYNYILGIKFFPFINVLAALILVAVGADDVFIFVDAWKQSKKEDKYIPVENRVGRTFNHAAVSIAVTSLTTSASFFANYINHIVSIRCFALFAGTAVLTNFIFMITWTPAFIIGLDVVLNWSINKAKTYTNLASTYVVVLISKGLANIKSLRANTDRKIFQRILPKLVEKAWFIWIPVLFLLGIAGLVVVFYYPKLQLPKSKEFQLFPTHQYMEYWDQKTRVEFRYEKDAEDRHRIPLYFVWGYEPADNGKWYDNDDLGTLVPDTNFNFSDVQSQLFLKDFVHDLLHSGLTAYSSERINQTLSFFEAAEVVLTKCKTRIGVDPIFDGFRKPCCNETKMPFSVNYLNHCVPTLTIGVTYYVPRLNVLGKPVFNQTNSVKAFFIPIASNKDFTTSYQEMDEFYEKIDQFMKSQNQKAPVGFNGGFVSGKYEFLFYALQKAIASGTYLSILLSLGAAAFLMLVTSLNVLLTLYAMLTITLAISVTIACFVLLGWHLNIIESITISLAVGLSIDFTIHYGVSYRQSKEVHRSARTKESFQRVGSAIIMAAFTTFVAGLAMMPSNIMPYLQLGIFLMVVMTFSWVYATFFFMSLCHIMGPNGNFCQIPLPKCCRKKEEEEEEEEGGQDILALYDPTMIMDNMEDNYVPAYDDFMIVP